MILFFLLPGVEAETGAAESPGPECQVLLPVCRLCSCWPHRQGRRCQERGSGSGNTELHQRGLHAGVCVRAGKTCGYYSFVPVLVCTKTGGWGGGGWQSDCEPTLFKYKWGCYGWGCIQTVENVDVIMSLLAQHGSVGGRWGGRGLWLHSTVWWTFSQLHLCQDRWDGQLCYLL